MEEKKIKKTFKDYYQNDEFKEKHLEYIKEKIKCECGSDVSRVSLARHKRSNMHIKNMNNLKTNKEYDEEQINKLINERLDKLLELKLQKLKLND